MDSGDGTDIGEDRADPRQTFGATVGPRDAGAIVTGGSRPAGATRTETMGGA